MATPTLNPADGGLQELLAAPAPSSVPEVIARMQAIDGLLAANDGIKWFNRLYLMVTQEVDLHPPGGAWLSPEWLTRLDVVFAGLYFSSLAAFLAGQQVPSAWTALFEARHRGGVDRIQFALAGMNAHINHDLALALIATDEQLNVDPSPGGLEHRDFQAVNVLLNSLVPATLTMLAGDALGLLAEDTGKVGRLLAFWNIVKARDLAWDFAGTLRGLDGLSRGAALAAQDALTGALGRAILLSE